MKKKTKQNKKTKQKNNKTMFPFGDVTRQTGLKVILVEYHDFGFDGNLFFFAS